MQSKPLDSAASQRHSRLPLAGHASESRAVHRLRGGAIDLGAYRRDIAARRRVAREKASLMSAFVGVVAMITIYVTLFFAADRLRPSSNSDRVVFTAPPVVGADVRF